MNVRLGLDKLQFFLSADDVKIGPDFPATIENPVNAATGEALESRVLYHADGVPKSGRVAHFNSRNYQFSVNHAASAGKPVCIVQFSAGAFRDSNLEPLGRDECMDVAQAVQRDLRDKGVRLDLSRAKLTRVDIAQNVKLAHPVPCYAPALAALGARKRTRKQDFGGTGFIVGNKTWEIGFYDKGEQMKALGYDAGLRPSNTVRPELRFMKHRLIKQSLGAETLPQLRKSWRQIAPVYDTSLRRDVFRVKLEQGKRASVDWQALANAMVADGRRQIWQHFKNEAALLLMVRDLGLDYAKQFAATQLGYDGESDTVRRQRDRIGAELERAAFALKVQATSTDGYKVLELYEELKAQVLGDCSRRRGAIVQPKLFDYP